MSRRILTPSILRSSPRRAFHTANTRSTPSIQEAKPSTKKTERIVVNVFRDEYSKSGGDDLVAEQASASYNPKDTNPQSEMQTAGVGNKINPLETSPANLEASRTRDENEGYPEKNVEKTIISKRVSPQKAKVVEIYEKEEKNF